MVAAVGRPCNPDQLCCCQIDSSKNQRNGTSESGTAAFGGLCNKAPQNVARLYVEARHDLVNVRPSSKTIAAAELQHSIVGTCYNSGQAENRSPDRKGC